MPKTQKGFCPSPTGRKLLPSYQRKSSPSPSGKGSIVPFRMSLFRLFLFSWCLLLVFAGSAEAAGWRVLHSEHDARIASYTPLEESAVLNLQLSDSRACITLGYAVNFPLVIDDLALALRVRADQPGVAIGVQIVLPQTIHPKTQRPVTYIVPGTRYTGSGNWETLGFWDRNGVSNLRAESEKIARLLKVELGIPFDTRGQYVRQIVLFAERIPQQSETKRIEVTLPSVTGHWAADVGNTEGELLFDPLNYKGFKVSVSARPMYFQGNTENTEWISPLREHIAAPLDAAPGGAARPAVRTIFSGNDSASYQLTSEWTASQSPASLVHVRFQDGILSLDDVPIGVRAIEYRGEPLAFLRNLQFNAVWLKEQPSPEIRLEAQHAGIWLICPPPSNVELETARVYDPSALGSSSPTLDSSYDNVLVWNLADEGSYARHPDDARRAQVIQNADRMKRRPLLATARSGIYDYSRTTDILMMSRAPLFSSLDLLDLYAWQREYPSLARPDTAFWCTVQTQPSPKMQMQWTMFEGNPPFISAVSYEQIKMQVYLALAAGARGILFTSHTPLTGNDLETEFRQTAVELANWELQLVEEWFSAGRVMPMLAKSNLSSASSAVIQAGRSRLLVPIWQERHNQSAVGPAVAGNVRYIVSGIPETYSAFHLVPGRAVPIYARQVAGGRQIELEEANLNSLIFFGEDDAIYAQVGKRAKAMGPRAAQLACRLAELELAMTEQVLTALRRARDTGTMPVLSKDNLPLIAMPEHETMLRTTRESLDLAKDLLANHNYTQAYLQAERATRGLRLVGRSLWLEATRHDLHPGMTPVSVSFATLPLYLTAYQRTNRAIPGQNRLPGGNMEMRSLLQAGWEQKSHKVEGTFVARNDVTPAAAHSGQMGLSLAVASSTPSDKPKQLETIPLWVTTPAMPVRMGEMICVDGWIRIPQPLESTVDGLMIFDSLGGEEMALRFLQTSGEWRQFAFYRIVPEDSNYYVFFALNGFGEAQLDDIRVSAVQFDVQQTPVQPGQPSPPGPVPYLQRLNPFQYFPPIPNWGR